MSENGEKTHFPEPEVIPTTLRYITGPQIKESYLFISEVWVSFLGLKEIVRFVANKQWKKCNHVCIQRADWSARNTRPRVSESDSKQHEVERVWAVLEVDVAMEHLHTLILH